MGGQTVVSKPLEIILSTLRHRPPSRYCTFIMFLFYHLIFGLANFLFCFVLFRLLFLFTGLELYDKSIFCLFYYCCIIFYFSGGRKGDNPAQCCRFCESRIHRWWCRDGAINTNAVGFAEAKHVAGTRPCEWIGGAWGVARSVSPPHAWPRRLPWDLRRCAQLSPSPPPPSPSLLPRPPQ